jgi:ribosomal protein L30
MNMEELIRVRLIRGLNKCNPKQAATLQGLGLRKLHQTKVLKSTAPIRGMIMRMQQWLDVEAFSGPSDLRQSARLRAVRAQEGAES